MNLKAGDDLKTQDEGGFGEVWAVDRVANTIDVRGNAETLSRSPGCVFAHTAVNPKAMQESLLTLGERFLEGGAADHCALRLLLRRPRPNVETDPVRRVLELERDVLAIQGPRQGSGKTYTGARMILALVEQGQRVSFGVGSAVSHKVIRNLSTKSDRRRWRRAAL